MIDTHEVITRTAKDVTSKPLDCNEIQKNLDYGKYVILIAITDDDKIIAYYSERNLPEEVKPYTEAERRSIAAGVGESQFSISYQRCCCNSKNKRGVWVDKCCCGSQAC